MTAKSPNSESCPSSPSPAASDHAAGINAAAGSEPVGGESRSHTPLAATLVGTFFGIGRLRPGPGTWASAATVLLWALASSQIHPPSRTWATVGVAAVVTLFGIPSATRIARGCGLKDPQFVVIDEVAGQLVALIAVPLAWKTFLASLILFRVFDILKPPPVRWLEQLPEGIGIVFDDLGAGVCALVVMHLLLHFDLLIK